MTNRYCALLLLGAMTFSGVVAARTTADIYSPEHLPAIIDMRLSELPEFIELSTTNGSDTDGRFTKRRILTAGGLLCEVKTYAYNFPGPSTCETNQPVPDPERFASLSGPVYPFPPFTTSESENL